MTRTTSATQTKQPLVVFGLDEAGKAKAGRFTAANADTAKAAAKSLKLNACQVTRELQEIASKLPMGRLHSQGKAFIPYIKRDLYDQLQAAAQLETSEAAKADDQPEQQTLPPGTTGLPRSWEEIGVGHLVLLQEAREHGWWEAVVIARQGETLTLRLRDFPKYQNFVRHVRTVALVHPGPE